MVDPEIVCGQRRICFCTFCLSLGLLVSLIAHVCGMKCLIEMRTCALEFFFADSQFEVKVQKWRRHLSFPYLTFSLETNLSN